MKTLFSLLFAGTVFAFAACSNSTQVKGMNDKDSDAKMSASTDNNSKSAKEERNKQTVMGMYNGMNNHDANAAFIDCAPNYMDYGDGTMKAMSLDSSRAMIADWLKAFPDFKGDSLKYFSQGDEVVVWGTYSGTWKGDMMGQKPSGKKFSSPDADYFRVDANGKIIEHRNVQPFSTIANQIGMKMQ